VSAEGKSRKAAVTLGQSVQPTKPSSVPAQTKTIEIAPTPTIDDPARSVSDKGKKSMPSGSAQTTSEKETPGHADSGSSHKKTKHKKAKKKSAEKQPNLPLTPKRAAFYVVKKGTMPSFELLNQALDFEVPSTKNPGKHVPIPLHVEYFQGHVEGEAELHRIMQLRPVQYDPFCDTTSKNYRLQTLAVRIYSKHHSTPKKGEHCLAAVWSFEREEYIPLSTNLERLRQLIDQQGYTVDESRILAQRPAATPAQFNPVAKQLQLAPDQPAPSSTPASVEKSYQPGEAPPGLTDEERRVFEFKQKTPSETFPVVPGAAAVQIAQKMTEDVSGKKSFGFKISGSYTNPTLGATLNPGEKKRMARLMRNYLYTHPENIDVELTKKLPPLTIEDSSSEHEDDECIVTDIIPSLTEQATTEEQEKEEEEEEAEVLTIPDEPSYDEEMRDEDFMRGPAAAVKKRKRSVGDESSDQPAQTKQKTASAPVDVIDLSKPKSLHDQYRDLYEHVSNELKADIPFEAWGTAPVKDSKIINLTPTAFTPEQMKRIEVVAKAHNAINDDRNHFRMKRLSKLSLTFSTRPDIYDCLETTCRAEPKSYADLVCHMELKHPKVPRKMCVYCTAVIGTKTTKEHMADHFPTTLPAGKLYTCLICLREEPPILHAWKEESQYLDHLSDERQKGGHEMDFSRCVVCSKVKRNASSKRTCYLADLSKNVPSTCALCNDFPPTSTANRHGNKFAHYMAKHRKFLCHMHMAKERGDKKKAEVELGHDQLCPFCSDFAHTRSYKKKKEALVTLVRHIVSNHSKGPEDVDKINEFLASCNIAPVTKTVDAFNAFD